MVDPSGTALVGAAMWGQHLYNSYKPRKVGIYGAPMVGKTTLDRYMTTPGEMEEISEEDRTIHRAFKGGDEGLQQIAGFRYLVDCLVNRNYRYRSFWSRFKGRKYFPRMVMLVGNKADRFFDETASKLWHDGRIGEHKIFDPFRDDLIRLQKAGIPTKRSFMATRIGWNVEITMIDLLTF